LDEKVSEELVLKFKWVADIPDQETVPSGLSIPKYQTDLAAGMDVCSCLDVTIEPMKRVLVPCGFAMGIPKGYEVQVRPRSGLAFKHGVTVLNSPGTIDADYTGELKVLLINLGEESYHLKRGERMAQIVVAPVVQAQWEVVDELGDTVRGIGGFGHTGS
jgi:dUTP pyrophosphatase